MSVFTAGAPGLGCRLGIRWKHPYLVDYLRQVRQTARHQRGPFTRYDVDFAIAVQDLKFDATPDGVHNGDVEVVLIAYARDGVALNLVVKKPQMSLKSQAFAAAQTVAVQLRYEIDVPKDELAKGGV